MAPILGIYASQISGHLWAPSGAYDSIATTTVGAGGASSITFSSIPSGYTHLQVRTLSRSDSAGINQLFARCNSDTGNNYSTHGLYTDGGGSAAGNATTSTSRMSMGVHAGASTTANAFGGAVIDILDYANGNKYKTIRSLTGIDANGSGWIWFASGLWMSTSAVSSLTFYPENGNFAQYSQFALYGIKGGN